MRWAGLPIWGRNLDDLSFGLFAMENLRVFSWNPNPNLSPRMNHQTVSLKKKMKNFIDPTVEKLTQSQQQKNKVQNIEKLY